MAECNTCGGYLSMEDKIRLSMKCDANGNVVWQGALLNLSDLAFYGTGEVIVIEGVSYYKDFSGNGNNLIINDKDFATSYIPANSTATLQVPSSAIAEIGNDGFWVIGGVAQQITYSALRNKITAICDRSKQDRIGALVIEKSTPYPNKNQLYSLVHDSVINNLYFSLNRTGTAYKQTDLTQVAANDFNINSLPTVSMPEYASINHILIGIDKFGFIVKLGSDYFRTADGVTFTSITLSIAPDLIVSDANGYRYARLSTTDGRVYRSTGNGINDYTFELAFTFTGNSVFDPNNFSSYGNDVVISAYSYSANVGSEIYYSVDSGLTFAKYDVSLSQRHLHCSCVHPNGTWFVSVGEAISTTVYRGIIYSTDKGGTWIQAPFRSEVYTAQIQPWSAFADGEYVWFGADSSPVSFVKINAFTFDVSEVMAFNSGGSQTTNNGFHPTFKNFIGFGYSSTTAYHVGRFAFTGKINLVLEQVPSVSRDYNLFGYVFNGKIAILNRAKNATLIYDVWNYTNQDYLLSTHNACNISSFDTKSDGSTYQGIPVVKVKKDETYSDGENIPIVPGDVVKMQLMLKRNPLSTGAGNIQIFARLYDSIGSARGFLVVARISNTEISALPNDGQYHPVDLAPATVPATINGYVPAAMSFLVNLSYGDLFAVNPNNYHLMLSKVNYTINSGQLNNIYKPISHIDKYIFKKDIKAAFILTDKIIAAGFGLNLVLDTKYPVLKLYNGGNLIEIGIVKVTGSLSYASSFYFDYNGVQVGSVGAALYGTSFSVDLKPLKNLNAAAESYSQNVIAPPLVVTLTKTSLKLRSPETGITTEFALANEISGELIGELLYESLHNLELI